MTTQFDLRFRDYLLFNCLHQFLSAPTQILYLLVTVFIVSKATAGHPMPEVFFVWLVIYVSLWAFQLLFLFIYLILGKNKTLLTHHLIAVEKDGIAVETKFVKALYFWPGIVRVVRRPGFIAIYVSAHGAIIVPRRAFSSAIEKKTFLSTLEARNSRA